MSRCARNSRPPLIASETTAIAVPRTVHPLTKEKPGARRLDEIKLWKDDPAGVERASEEIKARYARIFRV